MRAERGAGGSGRLMGRVAVLFHLPYFFRDDSLMAVIKSDCRREFA